MTPENPSVVCCFCGQSLQFKTAVQVSICLTTVSDEVQGLYAHADCLDTTLHESIPRLWDINIID
jgi:hypothetical protein